MFWPRLQHSEKARQGAEERSCQLQRELGCRSGALQEQLSQLQGQWWVPRPADRILLCALQGWNGGEGRGAEEKCKANEERRDVCIPHFTSEETGHKPLTLTTPPPPRPPGSSVVRIHLGGGFCCAPLSVRARPFLCMRARTVGCMPHLPPYMLLAWAVVCRQPWGGGEGGGGSRVSMLCCGV